MNDRVNLVFDNQPRYERVVADIADDEARLRVNGVPEARREIVEHDDLFARIDEGKHHMASDIARAARNQQSHECLS